MCQADIKMRKVFVFLMAHKLWSCVPGFGTFNKGNENTYKSDERADLFLRKIYELYSDFALKNPFYSLEMPIRAGNRLHFTPLSPLVLPSMQIFR